MRERPGRGGSSGDDQHQADQQPGAPAHAMMRGGPVHFVAGLLHSRAARASSAQSFGSRAVSTVSQPEPTASAAARLIAAMAMPLRSSISSAKRRPARRMDQDDTTRSRAQLRIGDFDRAVGDHGRNLMLHRDWRSPIFAAKMEELQS